MDNLVNLISHCVGHRLHGPVHRQALRSNLQPRLSQGAGHIQLVRIRI